MIVSRVIGGLGNQMFQYAIGRALSLKRNVPLVLDISQFDNYVRHQGFELDRIFNSKFQIATNDEIIQILGWQSALLVQRILSQRVMSRLRRPEFVLEPHFHFWQAIDTVPSKCYLQGYWQSPQYFDEYQAEIRDDFTFKLPFTGKNIDLSDRISQVNSVSVHVRRGDYLSNKKTTALHGLCSVDYYKIAIQKISSVQHQPVFFVFSDDITWAKKNLEIEYPCHYIDHNKGLESFNDMRLMSLCKHNIVANSSFSWWGAWLNSNQDKVVIAPKKWFATSINTGDLLPFSWTSI